MTATSLGVWLLLPIPLRGEEGQFNVISGLIWCSDRSSCLHEVAHALDREGGWISHGDDFGM
ncbi:MAG: hypothetical protein HUU11_18985, partial [Anaerolineales bacterium]|nr:hypothetical protein [Anaerolineales bacterium]